jgi:hypothetical protein
VVILSILVYLGGKSFMKKLLTRSLFSVALLGLGLNFASFNDYAGIPSTHSPSLKTYNLEVTVSPEDSFVKPMGIPSTH